MKIQQIEYTIVYTVDDGEMEGAELELRQFI